jgi:hypothetical protein
MNENCLEGLRCPECYQEDTIRIVGQALFTVTDDGTSTEGDIDWGDDSFASCPACNYEGNLWDFRITNQPDPTTRNLYEVHAFVKKRYATVVTASSEGDAVRKASDLCHIGGQDVEDTWEEDVDYYSVEHGDDARMLTEEEVKEEARRDPEASAKS